MAKFIRTAIDLGKNYFQVHGLESEGGRSISRKVKRSKMHEVYSQIEPCRVGMEACGSAHYWARQLTAMGHEVVLIPPAYIKPYVKRGKNDAVDAAAICEAMSRPDMRFVPIKSADQQAILMLHKTRELLVKQRTMAVNALRGHLAEFGIVAAKGIGRVDELLALAKADAALPHIAGAAVACLAQHLEGLDLSIETVDEEIATGKNQKRDLEFIDKGLHVGHLRDKACRRVIGDDGRYRIGLSLRIGECTAAARREADYRDFSCKRTGRSQRLFDAVCSRSAPF
jgi:transposase